MKKVKLAFAWMAWIGVLTPALIVGCGGGGDGGSVATSGGRTPAVGGGPAGSSNANSPLGTNLAGVDYWSSQLVFKDIFKQAGDWLCQDATGNAFNPPRNFPGYRSDGYPILGTGQTAATLMCRDLGTHYPAGLYTCFFDGQGSILFSGAAALVTIQQSPASINVVPSDEGIWLRILSTSATDPIRNIRLVMPGFLSSYEAQPFTPEFLDRCRPFKALRFMNWQKADDSLQQNWADRSTPGWFSQASQRNSRGVALEYMTRLANQLNADPWFCMPHRATDDYIRKFATMVRDQVNPNLKIYIEYSNEVWNGQFTEAQYAEQQGHLLGYDIVPGQPPDPFLGQLRFYARRSVEMFEIWRQVFGSTQRLVRVLASQSANPWTGIQIMDWPVTTQAGTRNASTYADALAIAPYLDLSPVYTDAMIAQWTVPQVIAHLTEAVPVEERAIAENRTHAAARQLSLIAYEGGQELVASPLPPNPTAEQISRRDTIVALFANANRDAGMHALYATYLNAWRTNGGRLFMHFNLTEKYGLYGSWGAVEWHEQSRSPKYDALTEFIRANPQWWR